MSESSNRRRARTRRKVVALAAAGAVVLAGATVTSLATWLDVEWVTAGVDGDPGVRASTFEIEQSLATDEGAWTDRETLAEAEPIDFDDIASALSPGEVAYGWVSLRAADGSIGGDVALVSAYTTGASPLGDALRYDARVHPDPSTCNAGAYATTGTALVAAGSTLSTGSGATTFELVADGDGPGPELTVCFRLELPDGASSDLMGETASIGWHFDAVSD